VQVPQMPTLNLTQLHAAVAALQLPTVDLSALQQALPSVNVAALQQLLPGLDLSALRSLLPTITVEGLQAMLPSLNIKVDEVLPHLQLPTGFTFNKGALPSIQVNAPELKLPTIPAFGAPAGAAECFWFMCAPKEIRMPQDIDFSFATPQFNFTIPVLAIPSKAALLPDLPKLPEAITLPFFEHPVIPFELPSITMPDIPIQPLPPSPWDFVPVNSIVQAVASAYNATTTHINKVLDIVNPNANIDIQLPAVALSAGPSVGLPNLPSNPLADHLLGAVGVKLPN
jgi:hypothetical protein